MTYPLTALWSGHKVTQRTANVLHAAGIRTPAHLKRLDFAGLLALPGAGITVAAEARRFVQPDFVIPTDARAIRIRVWMAARSAQSRAEAAKYKRDTRLNTRPAWTPADIQASK